MRNTSLSFVSALALSASAFATVTPGTLFGDSYIVKDGSGASAKFYSVLDVYIKCSSSADIISSTFGTSAYQSAYTQNQGKSFMQSGANQATSSWLPINDDGKSWDSFVTTGCRVQGSNTSLASGQAGFLGMQLDTNWSSASNGGQIVGTAGGAGWYPSIGASTSTNPYAKAGQYTGTGAVNTAKCISFIGGPNIDSNDNGITPGQSLTNYWMIGRFTIEVTGESASANNTLSMQFGVAGKNNGTTTFTGATQSAGRFTYTLTYAAVPAPGATALLGLAGMFSRRRRN